MISYNREFPDSSHAKEDNYITRFDTKNGKACRENGTRLRTSSLLLKDLLMIRDQMLSTFFHVEDEKTLSFCDNRNLRSSKYKIFYNVHLPFLENLPEIGKPLIL